MNLTFRTVLTNTIPLTQGVTQVEGEGESIPPHYAEGWRVILSLKAPFCDPWPNTEAGGHQVFTTEDGGLEIYKGEELKYRSGPMRWNVWRDENDAIRRIYAQNTMTPEDPHDWEIGGPVPDTDNVAFEGGEWVYTALWQASAGVIPA